MPSARPSKLFAACPPASRRQPDLYVAGSRSLRPLQRAENQFDNPDSPASKARSPAPARPQFNRHPLHPDQCGRRCHHHRHKRRRPTTRLAESIPPRAQFRPPPVKRRLLHPALGAIRPDRHPALGVIPHHPPPHHFSLPDPNLRSRHRHLRWLNGGHLDATGFQIEDVVRRTHTSSPTSGGPTPALIPDFESLPSHNMQPPRPGYQIRRGGWPDVCNWPHEWGQAAVAIKRNNSVAKEGFLRNRVCNWYDRNLAIRQNATSNNCSD